MFVARPGVRVEEEAKNGSEELFLCVSVTTWRVMTGIPMCPKTHRNMAVSAHDTTLAICTHTYTVSLAHHLVLVCLRGMLCCLCICIYIISLQEKEKNVLVIFCLLFVLI